ncbi:polysaccharide deacetylase family protein [Flaviramulus sp. BrNp1-15]|uniref:polysaccharide deacetylase family protein n=1 Tax=Flaviramulus sp. BrNp1-15 TaxID=2916754 RepID=UPI001EE82423|nr:polysaccharide deacetylase family protein [Flaviramulus sp. BrNp1-15]ULC59359.1 polysaccharide deacetylase family protein [Flaviramulus sp. BrNp1-15]
MEKSNTWNGEKSAVVLTYDDALNVHLDNVIPYLDKFNLKGTFYLIGDAQVTSNRLSDWRTSANNGHELGNHSLTHPCNGQGEGREWVQPERDLSKYSVERTVNEIRITNTLLEAIDGKTERTFAYPCGDKKIGNTNYYDLLTNDFVGARGVNSGMQAVKDINLNDVNAYFIDGHSGAYMIDLVKKAIETETLIVFLFHGVGGEHNLDVSLEAHNELIQYLAEHENDIWVAPMVDVAKFIKEKQS